LHRIYFYIFSSILRKQIVTFNISRNSLESPFQTAVGFLPPFEVAVGTYRRGTWRQLHAAATKGGRFAIVAAGPGWVAAAYLATTAN
jgi:hypothetical protein